MTLTVSKREREAEGIWKDLVMLRSIVLACRINRVPIWLYTAERIIPVAQMGSNLIMDLSSSTWVTVQSLQGSVEALTLLD